MSDTIKQIAEKFEKENPTIHVNVVDVPNAGDVLKTRALSGDMPDVINMYPQSIELQEWSKAGYFEDLTDKKYLHSIKNNYAEKFAIDNRIYNVPLTANVYGFYYNKTAFDELGLEAPNNWEEMELLVDTLIKKGRTPFAIAGSEGWTLNGYHQLAIATAAGGATEANDLLRFSDVNGIKINNPIVQKDFTRLDLLRKTDSMQKNWQGAGYNDAVVAFANGSSLIMPNGSWALPVINQQNPTFEIATFPFPADEEGKSLTIGSGDFALSISSKTKYKEEANKFVEYMTRPEIMQIYYDVDGSPTAVEGVKEEKDSPLNGLTDLAFTDRHIVWLAQNWISENDFYTVTTSYLTTGDKKEMVDGLNAFFNPMKATVK